MSNFNKLYKTICEHKIFKASTPEEGIRRKEQYAKILIQELIGAEEITKNPDGTHDAEGNINLSNYGLTRLPVKFNKVGGHFWCSHNPPLTTLEGSPRSVGGGFVCSNNQLTTLEGSPRSVVEDFVCSENQLTTLEGAPRSVGGGFSCYDNHLTTLEGAPRSVGGSFRCYNNKKKFTKEDVRKVCDVKGKIYV